MSNYLNGRDENVLWLMFKVAELVNEIYSYGSGKPVKCYRYMDGKDHVNFIYNTWSNTVEVSEPGVCLFNKIFETNDAKTKWERI